jgi:hypothetical protein
VKLREQILLEHSKANCTAIVHWVGSSPQRFAELFSLFLSNEYRVVQRAAWPVSYCVEAHPALLKKHFGSLVKALRQTGLHHSVKRNGIRLLQHTDIPVKYQGDVMDICFSCVQSPAEPVSTKAFALTVLGNLARLYPEIVPEIKLLIEEQLPHQTPSFIARAKAFLKGK